MINIFDNRGASLKGSGAHYQFEIEGRSYVYCYIRKNACSAFKKLICGVSGFRENVSEYKHNLQFMDKYHRINTLDSISDADHVICVYRDPIERALSIYLNKFVFRRGNHDIFTNYYNITTCDPREATFREFVSNYLSKLNNKIDPHCHTQYSHLKQVLYTDAILMETLYEEMSLLIGKKLSEKYFKHKSNASSSDGENFARLQLYSDATSEWLFREFHNHNSAILNRKTFIDESIGEKLREIYHDDVTLIQKINSYDKH